MKRYDEVCALFCQCCLLWAVNGDGCECPARDDVHPAGLMGGAPGPWHYSDDLGFCDWHTCEGCGTHLAGDRYEMIQLIEKEA